MYLAHADDIQLAVGNKILLSHVSFSIQPGDKIGIVGKNGTGKSTLLRTLTNKTQPRKGEIDVQTTTFYVPQEIRITEEEKALPVVSYALTKHEEGWDVFHRIEKLFDYKEITADKLMGQLSGGELTMLHLALALLVQPDMLLLDEPTNHLDSIGVERLMKELKAYRKALVIVSHDSYLLDQVTRKIFEIRDQKLNKYTGNYSNFVQQKAHETFVLERKLRVHTKEMNAALARKQQVSERTMRSDAAEEKYKAKGVPSILRGYFIDRAGKSTSHDMAIARKAERESREDIKEIKDKLKKTQTLNIELGESDSSLFSLIDINKATLTAGDKFLSKDCTLRVTNQDKVLLNGRNGTGKSSLLKAIHKQEGYKLESESKPKFPQLSLYIDQHYSLIDNTKTLVTHIAELAPTLEYEEIRKILGNFLFMKDDQVNRVAGTLSGGEKAKLALAMASVSPRTLLLLDEPTNHLDTESVDELVQALNEYEGGFIVVTHDIGFINKITWTQRVTL
ncbi:ABC-F family ATP-binding cassette domain-containing protein [bacterium]|nr:ABC-F family ATP-binding cassette domain-containing protein [bacterium]